MTLWFFFYFSEHKAWQLMWIVCLVDNSHEMSGVIFSKNNKINFRMSSATNLLSALRVNQCTLTSICSVICTIQDLFMTRNSIPVQIGFLTILLWILINQKDSFLQLNHLKLSTLSKIFSRRHMDFFSLFLPETGFDISCKLSPMETVCMKC